MVKISESLEASLPACFDVSTYSAIRALVESRSNTSADAFRVFRGGWLGVGHRFLACACDGDDFTSSVVAEGTAPPWPARFHQDRALFAFFVNGLSSLECFCYAAYGIGALVEPPLFKVGPNDLAGINPKKTKDQFAGSSMSGAPITSSLDQLLQDREYDKWRQNRNVLAHRIQPGRIIQMSVGESFDGTTKMLPTPPDSLDLSLSIDLDKNTTTILLNWLAKQLNGLMDALRDVCENRL